jgi:hypothetical protein
MIHTVVVSPSSTALHCPETELSSPVTRYYQRGHDFGAITKHTLMTVLEVWAVSASNPISHVEGNG